ncbi:hypothetical protein K2173_007805 [Erythroxylum novogranatense]|uniref:SANT domain-containing protein n=1 Tax=Erythroxylum novogranatense TaxID=1862640 RepID=A0AAV8TIZ2_9ROSI|nr:hypothetical protein K2173_007805 [Erythroxylum novogranatense]
MPPSRKSRSVNRRYSYINDVSPNKSGDNASKSRLRKRKLSDMLGPQWNKEELERFYKAYRKHGTDWEKVAIVVRNRSEEMVEALYTMNRAYLSLPKGYASAAGLIAMMTDHYANMEDDSESEQEANKNIGVSERPQKRARGIKGLDSPPVPDLLQSHSTESSYGCLSLLKKRRSVSRPWAVGKRTPRVPISFACDKDNGGKYLSPIRHNMKVKDALDDDVTHKLALALTEASKGGVSPQASLIHKWKMETPSPIQNGERMHAESVMTSAKLRGGLMDDGGCELSLGSTEADIGDYSRDRSLLKGRKYNGKKPEIEESITNDLDEIKEACSGTEEGQKLSLVKGKFDIEVERKKIARTSNKGPRKRSKKVLFGEGEDAAFDALQTLADLSLRLPETPIDTESSVHVEEENVGIVAKSKYKGHHSSSGAKVNPVKKCKQGKALPSGVVTAPEKKDGMHKVNAVIHKGKKSLPSKIPENANSTSNHLDEIEKIEGKVVKPPECTSSSSDHGRESNDSVPSATKVLSSSQFNLPTKVRSRRKLNTPKSFVEKDVKFMKNITEGQSADVLPPLHNRALSLKEKLSNCLSWYQVRRWCVFEWFYSAIDYPWFAKREFVEYLDHVRLGHIPRLTRIEWGVIRSSLGRPRRFSEQFLKEEKEKLNQYRESVRNHYAELRAGTKDGLPADLARPLSVGQQIIAIHPKTREIHDGIILTVDHNRCLVQFDQPEIGVEFVMDVDCMPLNPLENMPATLTQQNIVLNKFIDNFKELKMTGKSVDGKMDSYTNLAPFEHMENANGPQHTFPSTLHKGDSVISNAQIGHGLGKVVDIQQAVKFQPSIIAQVQAKEADIHALSELTRALDKKEAVVSELRRLNEEVLEDHNDGENSLKDSELFKKQYAAVLLQLNEINEQVSSALFCLRQRNTYQGIPLMSLKPMESVVEQVGHYSSCDHSGGDIKESGCHVVDIVETSRVNARTMVDVAMQAVSVFKKEESGLENVEEVIDYVNNQLSARDLSMPAMTSSTPARSVRSTWASEDQLSSSTINHNAHDQNKAKIPSDLIAQCVATLLVIQKCTERQFPPSDVARVLDSAVTSLKPCSSQNLPIYAEIQKCMGIIRNQILALIPT